MGSLIGNGGKIINSKVIYRNIKCRIRSGFLLKIGYIK